MRDFALTETRQAFYCQNRTNYFVINRNGDKPPLIAAYLIKDGLEGYFAVISFTIARVSFAASIGLYAVSDIPLTTLAIL